MKQMCGRAQWFHTHTPGCISCQDAMYGRRFHPSILEASTTFPGVLTIAFPTSQAKETWAARGLALRESSCDAVENSRQTAEKDALSMNKHLPAAEKQHIQMSTVRKHTNRPFPWIFIFIFFFSQRLLQTQSEYEGQGYHGNPDTEFNYCKGCSRPLKNVTVAGRELLLPHTVTNRLPGHLRSRISAC